MKKIFIILCALFLSASVFALSDDDGNIEGPLLDPQDAVLLGRAADFAVLLDGEDIRFAEGPVWRKSTSEVFFTDIPKNAIYRWTPEDGKTLFKRPAGLSEGPAKPKMTAGANGLALTAEGELLICDQGNRRISKLNEKNFTVETLADSYLGRRLNQPNDVCVSPNGDVFFTDPALWRRSGREITEEDLDFNGIYRLSKGGALNLVDITPIPNGIALSHDGKRLFIGNSRGENPCYIVYELGEGDEKYKSKKVFCNLRLWEKAKIIGTPDGLAVDKNGYVYASGNAGLHIFSPKLEHLGYIEFETQVTNCCVIEDESGKPAQLFITASKAIWLADISKILKAAEARD